jgi:hypothetical protein
MADMMNNAIEQARREVAGKIAHDLVMEVAWPWTDRQKRLWYIGVLADTGWLLMDYLESATIDQLQADYKSIYGSR